MVQTSIHPYAASAYARALAGTDAVAAPEWGSHVLSRPIPESGLRDAIGVYPMTPIASDADIGAGLQRLAAEGLVSVVLVPDPLFSPPPERLAEAFCLCRPFKTHYVIDRQASPYAPTKHHRQEIRRAQRRCRVEVVALADHLQTWSALYDGLKARHAISGLAAFSDGYFKAMAEDPRITALAAFVDQEVGAMALWFEHEGVAYNHLGAANALGYANGANYALYDAAVSHFDGADRLNLGGAAGSDDDPHDGLAFFKKGFANAEAKAMLCGAVLDRARYADLAQGAPANGYFPSYRSAR